MERREWRADWEVRSGRERMLGAGGIAGASVLLLEDAISSKRSEERRPVISVEYWEMKDEAS